MTLKTLTAVMAAAALATPLVYAAGDKAASATSDKAPSASSGSASTSGTKTAKADAKSDGGAAAMFKSMDKDGDGMVTKEEAQGTPHEKDFAKLDKDKDGKLSPEEHAAAPEHAGKAKSAKSTTSSGPRAAAGTEQSKKY